MSDTPPNPAPNNPGGNPPETAPPSLSFSADDIKAAGIPDSYFKDGALNLKDIGAHLAQHGEAQTKAAERAQLVPADGKYDFGVPKEWKAPEGIKAEDLKDWQVSEFKVNAFAPIAKELNLTQAEISKVVSAWATADAQEMIAEGKRITDHAKAEIAKLGTNGAEQWATLETALTAKTGLFGERLGAIILAGLSSADDVRLVQKFMADAGKLAERGNNLPDPPKPKTHAQVLYGGTA